jgi:hypothetical protein
MVAFIVAVVCIGAALFSVLPISGGPQWGPELAVFIKGMLPFLGFLIGFLALLVGIADLRGRIISRRESAKNTTVQAKDGDKNTP